MKKTVRILALALVLVMMVACLASCGNKLSGKYGNEVFSLTFDGDSFTATTLKVFSISGTYEIRENEEGVKKIVFALGEDSEANKKYFENLLGGTGGATLEEGDGYIKIGGVKFNEVKD